MTHKGTSDLHKLEREKRKKIREERREKYRALQRGMTTGVTDPLLDFDPKSDGFFRRRVDFLF